MTDPTDALLVAERVRKTYRTGAEEVEALRDVDLVVHEGEFVSVMGPSGSGKTTLLNCCSGLDDIDGGRVLLDGVDLHALSDAAPHREPRVVDGIHLPGVQPDPGVQRGRERRAAVAARGRRREGSAPARVGDARAGRARRRGCKHRPAELSGGEQQRVTVARALAGPAPRGVGRRAHRRARLGDRRVRSCSCCGELNADGLTLIVVTHDEGVGGSANRASSSATAGS